MTGIRQDCYLVITGDKDGTKYIIEDQSKDMETGILSPNPEMVDDKWSSGKCFDLSGRMLPNNRKHQGIYIRGGKKYLNIGRPTYTPQTDY